MVEVAGAEDIVALFVLTSHVLKQHLQLGIALGGIRSIGGQMRIKNHQFSAVFDRDP